MNKRYFLSIVMVILIVLVMIQIPCLNNYDIYAGGIRHDDETGDVGFDEAYKKQVSQKLEKIYKYFSKKYYTKLDYEKLTQTYKDCVAVLKECDFWGDVDEVYYKYKSALKDIEPTILVKYQKKIEKSLDKTYTNLLKSKNYTDYAKFLLEDIKNEGVFDIYNANTKKKTKKAKTECINKLKAVATNVEEPKYITVEEIEEKIKRLLIKYPEYREDEIRCLVAAANMDFVKDEDIFTIFNVKNIEELKVKEEEIKSIIDFTIEAYAAELCEYCNSHGPDYCDIIRTYELFINKEMKNHARFMWDNTNKKIEAKKKHGGNWLDYTFEEQIESRYSLAYFYGIKYYDVSDYFNYDDINSIPINDDRLNGVGGYIINSLHLESGSIHHYIFREFFDSGKNYDYDTTNYLKKYDECITNRVKRYLKGDEGKEVDITTIIPEFTLKPIKESTGFKINIGKTEFAEGYDISISVDSDNSEYYNGFKYKDENGEISFVTEAIEHIEENGKVERSITHKDLQPEKYKVKVRCWYITKNGIKVYSNWSDEKEIVLKESATTGYLESYNFSKVKKGDIIKFGSYEQDLNYTNGKEPIEWIVLDKTDDSVFLLSKYALDRLPYNDEYAYVTWETCSLRKWLNSNFIKSAFNKTEQEMIKTTKVKNTGNNVSGGKDTKDKVFLLSSQDMINSKYGFPAEYMSYDYEKNKKRKCAFAWNKGIKYIPDTHNVVQPTTDGEEPCWWYLRSLGMETDRVPYVTAGGDVYTYGASVDDNGETNYYGDHSGAGVRPVMWVSLK